MGNIVSAVTYLQTQIANVSGIRSATANPTDSRPAFPAVTSYISALNESRHASSSMRTDLYTITTDVHFARVDLARTMAVLQPFWDAILDVIWAGDKNLNGNVDTVISVAADLRPDTEWGGVETMAITFRTQVKVVST